MYRSVDIANFFLKQYGKPNGITPLKLNKLVYITHAWKLALTDVPLLDENPEAWMYGVIIPSVYHKYKSFKNNPIYSYEEPDQNIYLDGTDKLIDKIWLEYSYLSDAELGTKTSMTGTPWDIRWTELKNGNDLSLQIPNTIIRDYYKKLIKKGK